MLSQTSRSSGLTNGPIANGLHTPLSRVGISAATCSAARATSAGMLDAYTSMVKLVLAWPSRSLTAFTFSPAAEQHRRVQVAQVMEPDRR